MDVKTLLENATQEELPVLVSALRRAQARPAIVVTLQEFKRKRRYVVAAEDESRFDGLTVAQIKASPWNFRLLFFGGQWLRGYGRVDEMYCSALEFDKIISIARVDRNKVYGR